MSKAILLSIRPEWCAKILNGEKTVEVRKNKSLAKAIQKLINEYGYADIYVYCTKDKNIKLFQGFAKPMHTKDVSNPLNYYRGTAKKFRHNFNGKVAFKFRCREIENAIYDHDDRDEWFATPSLNDIEFEDASCLTFNELKNYLINGRGYAIHISNLEIFKSPKKISKFKRPKWNKCGIKDKNGLYQCDKCPYGKNGTTTCEYDKPIKAPQNYCYVEVEE